MHSMLWTDCCIDLFLFPLKNGSIAPKIWITKPPILFYVFESESLLLKRIDDGISFIWKVSQSSTIVINIVNWCSAPRVQFKKIVTITHLLAKLTLNNQVVFWRHWQTTGQNTYHIVVSEPIRIDWFFKGIVFSTFHNNNNSSKFAPIQCQLGLFRTQANQFGCSRCCELPFKMLVMLTIHNFSCHSSNEIEQLKWLFIVSSNKVLNSKNDRTVTALSS